MKIVLSLLGAGVFLLLIPGCFETKEITTYGDLVDAAPSPVRIMTVDTTIYDLDRFTCIDSLIEGAGNHLVAGARVPFSGRIPMSDIVYIQSTRLNILGTVAGIGVLGIVAAGIEGSAHGREISIYRTMGGGGSCPYVYAWNGTGYVRQGEVFGTALGKGLETTSGCMLPAASSPGGIIRVRLADERPETHYVKSVRLTACEAPPGVPVFLDTRDRPWALPSIEPPLRAPREIMRNDGIRWKSNDVRPAGQYRDTLDLTLPRTGEAGEGSLVVHAINTHLSESAFGTLFGFLGAQSLPFLYRIEHDPETIALMKRWIDECALHVDVWNGTSWKNAGVILPEANEVPFTRVVRIRLPEEGPDSVLIRLRMLSEAWEIDAVGIDWSPGVPLAEHELPLLSAFHSSPGNADSAIRLPGAGHSMLLPGESLDMTFRAFEPREGSDVRYECHASGYLYEWFPEKPSGSDEGDPLALAGMDRMSVAGYYLRNHEAFLPLLFARWSFAH
jgi:hypothetical protein